MEWAAYIKVENMKLFWIIVVVTLVAYVSYLFFRQPPQTYTCAQFTTQQQAEEAYYNGASYLDRNKDGIACNALLNQ